MAVEANAFVVKGQGTMAVLEADGAQAIISTYLSVVTKTTTMACKEAI